MKNEKRCSDCNKRIQQHNKTGYCERCFYKTKNMSDKRREQRRKAGQRFREKHK